MAPKFFMNCVAIEGLWEISSEKVTTLMCPYKNIYMFKTNNKYIQTKNECLLKTYHMFENILGSGIQCWTGGTHSLICET